MITPAQTSAMDHTIAALTTEYFEAAVAVGISVDFFTDGSAKSAAAAALAAASKTIDDLAGSLRTKVINGTVAFSGWSTVAKLVHEQIAEVAGTVGTWSMSGVLGSAAAETVKQAPEAFKAAAETAAKVANAGTGLVLAVVALVIIWAVLK